MWSMVTVVKTEVFLTFLSLVVPEAVQEETASLVG